MFWFGKRLGEDEIEQMLRAAGVPITTRAMTALIEARADRAKVQAFIQGYKAGLAEGFDTGP